MDKCIGKKETEKCKFHRLTGGLPETTSTHKRGTINHRLSDYAMHKIHSKHPKIASDISKSKNHNGRHLCIKRPFSAKRWMICYFYCLSGSRKKFMPTTNSIHMVHTFLTQINYSLNENNSKQFKILLWGPVHLKDEIKFQDEIFRPGSENQTWKFVLRPKQFVPKCHFVL